MLFVSCARADAPGASFGSLPPDWSAPFGDGRLLHPDVVQNGQNRLHWRSFASGMPSDSVLRGIVAGPDRNSMWYTNAKYGTIGRMGMDGSTKVYQLHGGAGQFLPGYVTVGSDGKLYMGGCIQTRCNLIGVLSGTGKFSTFRTPSGDGPGQFRGLALGPDGNVWFAERTHIGRITPAGQITEYGLPNSHTPGGHVTTGGDGQVWFDENSPSSSGVYTVGRIDPISGKITELKANCPFQCYHGGPLGIAESGNGDVYLLADQPGYADTYYYLGRFVHSGNRGWIDITGTGAFAPLVEGPDGALWWGANCEGAYPSGPPCSLARYDPATRRLSSALDRGMIVAVPASGPDGNVWGIGASGPYPSSPNSIVVFVRNVLIVHPEFIGFAKTGATVTLTATYTGPSALSASSSNPSVASVTPSSPGTFIVTANAVGSATITVQDTMRNSFNVPVTVN
jgi:putative type II/III system pilus formation protein